MKKLIKYLCESYNRYIEEVYNSDKEKYLDTKNIANDNTHLTFDYEFNQKLKEDDIPNNVRYLIFGYLINI